MMVIYYLILLDQICCIILIKLKLTQIQFRNILDLQIKIKLEYLKEIFYINKDIENIMLNSKMVRLEQYH